MMMKRMDVKTLQVDRYRKKNIRQKTLYSFALSLSCATWSVLHILSTFFLSIFVVVVVTISTVLYGCYSFIYN